LALLPVILMNPMHFSVVRTLLTKDPLFKPRFLDTDDSNSLRGSILRPYCGLPARTRFRLISSSHDSVAFGRRYGGRAGVCISSRRRTSFHISWKTASTALVGAFAAMNPDGHTFALSVFGFCFRCDACADLMFCDIPLALLIQTLSADRYIEDAGERLSVAHTARTAYCRMRPLRVHPHE
jgi:hypothetical protein